MLKVRARSSLRRFGVARAVGERVRGGGRALRRGHRGRRAGPAARHRARGGGLSAGRVAQGRSPCPQCAFVECELCLFRCEKPSSGPRASAAKSRTSLCACASRASLSRTRRTLTTVPMTALLAYACHRPLHRSPCYRSSWPLLALRPCLLSLSLIPQLHKHKGAGIWYSISSFEIVY